MMRVSPAPIPSIMIARRSKCRGCAGAGLVATAMATSSSVSTIGILSIGRYGDSDGDDGCSRQDELLGYNFHSFLDRVKAPLIRRSFYVCSKKYAITVMASPTRSPLFSAISSSTFAFYVDRSTP